MKSVSLQTAGFGALSASLVFLMAAKNTATYNAFSGLLLLCLLVSFFKGRRDFGAPVDGLVLVGYGAALLGLLVPAIVVGGASFEKAVHFCYLTLSFWLAFYGVRAFGLPSVRTFAVAGLISAGVVLYTYYFTPAHDFARFSFWAKETYNQTGTACMMALIFPLVGLFSLRRDWLWQGVALLGALGAAYGLFLSQSRGAAAGLLAGGLAVLILSVLVRYGVSFKKLVAASLVTVLVFFSAVFGLAIYTFSAQRQVGDLTRLKIYKTSVVMWQEHQLFGVGLSNYEENYRQYVNRPDTQIEGGYGKNFVVNIAHNDFFEMLATGGVVAAAGYVIMTLTFALFLLRMFYYRRGDAWSAAALWLFFAIWLRGMVDEGVYDGNAWQVFFGLLGVMAAVSGGRELE